jgi:beta-lactamase regulating signal transducer with metallopeptidase domain
MENLLIYFAKVNGLIILFYLMYVLFLRKETFFVSNRFYFIIGLLLSLVLPLITFTKTIWVEPAPVAEFYQETTSVNSDLIAIPIQENPIDWTIILLSAYVIISIAIILKIGVELASFFKRIQKQNKQKGSDYTLINSNSIENPFSFFSYIIINKNMFTEEEIEHILTHESVHVKQKHSIDVLFGKLFCAFFWVNPIIWLYRKAMLQNLEFIADNETFQQIENKYEYQKTLLKVVTHQHDLSITNQFYQSLIKKRIVMLHTNQSHKKNVWKYATILPLLVSFMLLFQIETVAQVKENSKVATYAVSSNFSSILTKNTTDKELRELEKSFSDEKYKLKISKVKRNKEGEIIGIKLSFDSGKTYNQILERKSTEPIDDIRIYINSDKDDNQTCGFEEIKNTEGINWNDAKSLSSVEIKKSNTDDMIFIINGKEYTKEEMKGKIAELDGAIEMNEDVKNIKKVMVFKGNTNISDEPKTMIYLDENMISEDELKKIDVNTIKSVDVKKGKSNGEIRIVTSYNYTDKDPEILFDNKVISKEDLKKLDKLNKLDKNEIESISIKNNDGKKSIEIKKKSAKAIVDTSLKEARNASETEEARIELEKAKIELEKAKEELEKARIALEKATLSKSKKK